MEIPVNVNDATPRFVTEALRSSGAIGDDVSVAAVRVEPIGEGIGIVGQLARLHLTYDADVAAPASLVLKLPSLFPQNRAVGSYFRLYEREGEMYSHVLHQLPCRVPVAYLSHVDTEADEFALLLEDVGGLTPGDQITGVTLEQAQIAVSALAALHASWWNSPRLSDLGWLPTVVDEPILCAGPMYRQSWPRYLELLGEVLTPEQIAIGERVKLVLEEFCWLATSSPWTVYHGDFRADNLLFDLDAPTPDQQVVILDWQVAARGPGASDLAYFLCQSLPTDLRRAHEDELIQQWYADVGARLGGGRRIPGYPYDELMRDYRRCALVTTVIQVTAAGQMDPANERGRRMLELGAERAFTAAADHDGPDLYEGTSVSMRVIPAQRVIALDETADLR